MKKQSDLSRLTGYAGNYRYFTYASWVLSAVSALVALVPFVYIWKILRDVHFSYDGKTEVIKGVSLEIQTGQTVAFGGSSGGGKTTVSRLAARF